MKKNNLTSKEYWEKREAYKLKKGLKDLRKIEKELVDEYKKAMNEIGKEISNLFYKYAKDNNLSYSDAKKYLNSGEFREFKRDLKSYMKLIEETGDEELLLELNTLAMKSRISRLEEMFYQCGKHINELANETNEKMEILLTDTLKNSYYEDIYNIQKFVGVGYSFAELDKDTIEYILKYPWSGNDYSSRIWENKRRLLKVVKEELTQMIIQGRDLKQISKSVSKRLDTHLSNSMRLINTEHARVMSEACKMAYIESEIDKYQILSTLDKRTSDICQEMDGKVFKVDEAIIGKNMPPFHPNCRTTTIGYFEDISTRIARDKNGKNIEIPSNITYKEWLKMYNIF